MRLSVLALCLVPSLALSAWTSTPSFVATLGGEQVQPKIRTSPVGGAYVSWFDNSSGGYDVRLQRLDANGDEVWASNGILIADRNYSSTQDYDLTVDANGNALLAFRDDRSGSSQVTAQKVSPSGTLQWGAGVTPSTLPGVGAGSGNSPKICALPNGQVVVGWSGSNNFTLVRLSSLGTVVGTPSVVSEPDRAMTLSDLEAGEGDRVIALWIRNFTFSFLSSKWLFAQKYDASGNGVWNGTASGTWTGGNPVIVFSMLGQPGYGAQGSSVQNGYFPTIISDQEGGFVTAWYETGGPRHAYLQHVDAGGVRLFGENGVPNTGDTPGRIRVSAAVAYDRWSRTYYVASEEVSSATQSTYRTIVQKFNRTGLRQWGPTGIVVQSDTTNQKSFTQVQLRGDGCAVYGFESRPGSAGVVHAAGVNGDGSIDYGAPSQTLVFDGGTGKSRLTSFLAPSGDSLLTWSDGSSGSYDVAAARVGAGGRIGNGATRITGTIHPADYVAEKPGVNWLVVIEQGTNREKHLVRTDASGNFAIDTNLSGSANLTVDGSHWTKARIDGVMLGSGAVNFAMTNGDSDGSGEVDAADIDAVILDFGVTIGTSAYILDADLDGSGEVDAADIDICIANFGAVDQ